jgi:hypothetical protein
MDVVVVANVVVTLSVVTVVVSMDVNVVDGKVIVGMDVVVVVFVQIILGHGYI